MPDPASENPRAARLEGTRSRCKNRVDGADGRFGAFSLAGRALAGEEKFPKDAPQKCSDIGFVFTSRRRVVCVLQRCGAVPTARARLSRSLGATGAPLPSEANWRYFVGTVLSGADGACRARLAPRLRYAEDSPRDSRARFFPPRRTLRGSRAMLMQGRCVVVFPRRSTWSPEARFMWSLNSSQVSTRPIQHPGNGDVCAALKH